MWQGYRGPVTVCPGWHARPAAEDASDPSARHPSPKSESLWISLEQNWTGSINNILELAILATACTFWLYHCMC